MSVRRVLVSFLDQTAPPVEHQRKEEELLHLLRGGGYVSCIICLASVDGNMSCENFRVRAEKACPNLVMHLHDISLLREQTKAHGSLLESILSEIFDPDSEHDILVGGKPCAAEEQLRSLLRSGQLRGRIIGLPSPGEENHDDPGEDFESFIGRIARYDDVGILIQGETGTGKTFLARRIHEAGLRSRGPLIEVNCGSIPSALVESELFGHVKGAFTGANDVRLGKIRAANGGTLFLDEVGELELGMQTRLLKVLDDKLVFPVGSEKPIRVDIRVIAATNRDLEAMVRKGSYRFDLFNRLNQVCVRMPPLRERRREIEGIAAMSLKRWNAAHAEAKAFSPSSLRALREFDWPGNIRELENAVTAACVRCPGSEILERHLALSSSKVTGRSKEERLPPIPEGGLILKDLMSSQEWAYYRSALIKTGGKYESAARLLGMTGHAFRKALRERYAGKLSEMIIGDPEQDDWREDGNSSDGRY